MHVCTVSELVRSLVERRGLSERDATELIASVLHEDPATLPVRSRLSNETRLRIDRLAGAPAAA